MNMAANGRRHRPHQGYPLVDGTRQHHFARTNSKLRKQTENTMTPTSLSRVRCGDGYTLCYMQTVVLQNSSWMSASVPFQLMIRSSISQVWSSKCQATLRTK